MLVVMSLFCSEIKDLLFSIVGVQLDGTCMTAVNKTHSHICGALSHHLWFRQKSTCHLHTLKISDESVPHLFRVKLGRSCPSVGNNGVGVLFTWKHYELNIHLYYISLCIKKCHHLLDNADESINIALMYHKPMKNIQESIRCALPLCMFWYNTTEGQERKRFCWLNSYFGDRGSGSMNKSFWLCELSITSREETSIFVYYSL